MKNITVFGATGMLGKPVTDELIKSGFRVTALVRDTDKAKKEFPSGVTFVKGDLADLKAIEASIQNADAIYISVSNKSRSSTFNAEKHGLANILQAARRSNIKQVVFLSSFLARDYKGDWWMYLDKKGGIDQVKNAGIPYTIFYASSFMENFYRGMIMNHKVRVLKHPIQSKFFWIAANDYAKIVAKAFNTNVALNKEYAAQGPESFTMKEAAEVFAKNYTKEKLTVSETPFKVIKFLGYIIPPMNVIAKMAEVNIYTNEVFESNNTWEELGKPLTTIAVFASQSKR